MMSSWGRRLAGMLLALLVGAGTITPAMGHGCAAPVPESAPSSHHHGHGGPAPSSSDESAPSPAPCDCIGACCPTSLPWAPTPICGVLADETLSLVVAIGPVADRLPTFTPHHLPFAIGPPAGTLL